LAWLDVAPVAFQDGDASAQWIAEIRPLLDPKSILEQAGLAESLLACAERQSYPADYAQARDALKPFLQGGEMTAAQWLVYASACSGSGDSASAEQGYRQALKLDSDNVLAENNLADLLRQKGDANSLKEAEALATQAVTNHATDSNASAYFDTLARVFLKEGRPDDAIGAFAKANALNPKDLSILVGLAGVCADNNHLDNAVHYLSQIDNLVLPTTHLDPELAAELDRVRQIVRKMSTGSSVSGTTFTPGGK
jgi:Tfp pilus assembly protein PilF